MDLARVHKKLAEAEFFLGKMIEEEPRIFGNREPFDFYLSAFLSASRSVDYRLRREHGAIFPAWRKAWNASLTDEARGLMKFIDDDRNVEVHESGSNRNVGQEGVKFPIGTYNVDGSTITVTGPPGIDAAIGYRPTYSFTVSGTDRKVTEVCNVHLALLMRMVTEFEADQRLESRPSLASKKDHINTLVDKVSVFDASARVAPAGLQIFATDFLGAAKAVPAPQVPFAPARPYLLCHTLELALKALLSLKGFPLERLKGGSFGHDLENLLDEAERNGLGEFVKLNEQQIFQIRRASNYYAGKAFEYPAVAELLSGMPGMPDIVALMDMAEILVAALREPCLQSG